MLLSNGLVATFFFLGLVLSLELGRRLRLHDLRSADASEISRFGMVQGAVFGLMGLLLGFTFAWSSTRFDTRRDQIVDEANAIGTAWLRLDLLPDSTRQSLRGQFRQYVDARLSAYRAMPDTMAAKQGFDRANAMQQQIWTDAVRAAAATPALSPAVLLLPALNEMFDMAGTRHAAFRAHLPRAVYGLLIFLVLCCGVMAGYGMTDRGRRNWLHVLGFALVLVITLYVIEDFEYPRRGIITLQEYDQILVDLRSSMGN